MHALYCGPQVLRRAASVAQLATVSAALVVATVAFELVVGRTIDHGSRAELVGNYAFWRGRLWTWMLLALALSPFLWAAPGSQHDGSRR